MPKTVIIRQTWRCQTCYAAGCWACQWDNNSLEGKPCPHCEQGTVELETDTAKCGTLTVMGAEDIEDEIAQTIPSERFARRGRERASRGRSPLTPTELATTGLAEISAYRADRLLDIAHAIREARKREHKP